MASTPARRQSSTSSRTLIPGLPVTLRRGNQPRHASFTPSIKFTGTSSLSGFGGRGENSAVRGQIFDASPAHGGSMGQEAADSGPHRRIRSPVGQSPAGCQGQHAAHGWRVAGFSTPDPVEPESYSSVGAESDRRLRANSSARRDGTLEHQQTSLPPSPAVLPSIPGLASDPDFPHRIPATIDIPRQKAGCPRNVCMPVTPGCPCAAVESTVASNRVNAYRPLVQNSRINCADLAKAPAG